MHIETTYSRDRRVLSITRRRRCERKVHSRTSLICEQKEDAIGKKMRTGRRCERGEDAKGSGASQAHTDAHGHGSRRSGICCPGNNIRSTQACRQRSNDLGHHQSMQMRAKALLRQEEGSKVQLSRHHQSTHANEGSLEARRRIKGTMISDIIRACRCERRLS